MGTFAVRTVYEKTINMTGSGTPVTAYANPTIASNDGGIAASISIRIGAAVAVASGPLGQVRVTLKTGNNASPGVQGITCDHVSIGVSTGTMPNTVATPVELTFGGSSGCTIDTASAQQTSDWANLSFLSTDTLVVICDQGAAEIWIAANGGTATIGSFAAVWFKSATASWNVAAPAAFTNLGVLSEAIVSIETR